MGQNQESSSLLAMGHFLSSVCAYWGKNFQKISLKLYFLSGVVAFFMVLGSYGAEIFWGKVGCFLCYVERLCAGGIALVSVIVMVVRYAAQRSVRNNVFFLSIMLIAWGGFFFISVYHMALQFHWLEVPSFCQSHALPSLDEVGAYLFSSRPSCDTRTLDIFGIPAPAILSFVSGFFGIFFSGAICFSFCHWVWRRKSKNPMGRL